MISGMKNLPDAPLRCRKSMPACGSSKEIEGPAGRHPAPANTETVSRRARAAFTLSIFGGPARRAQFRASRYHMR
jgi:hypothetical protein